jgi:hypothetical protein
LVPGNLSGWIVVESRFDFLKFLRKSQPELKSVQATFECYDLGPFTL